MSRRQFLLLAAGTGALAGCATVEPDAATAVPRPDRVINAGLASNYAQDGVYDRFRHQGFFLVRNGSDLKAISAICTHKKCKLVALKNRSFSCPCHGSTFARDGKVTLGPAKRDLPVLEMRTDENSCLQVRVPQ